MKFKCKCKHCCSRELEVYEFKEKKDIIKLIFHKKTFLGHTRKEIFVSKKKLKELLNYEEFLIE